MTEMVKTLEIALGNERQERDFYLTQSKKTENAFGKTMFARIADDEDEHYRRLKKIHQELVQSGTWPETVPGVMGGTDIMETLRSIARIAERMPEASKDDIEALKIAIAFEEKGHGFYTRLAGQAESPAEKEFFTLLASMEWEHLQALKEASLFYESPEDWFARHEKPHLEG